MKPGRRDHSRRITPDTVAIYARKAHALRAQAYRGTVWGLWARVMKLLGRANR